MTTIIRHSDEATFVIPDFRELIAIKKTALLKREFFMLAENYGDNVYIRKKTDTQLEAVFSHDQGYLLGETVWHHFGKPVDMVYCELLPDEHEALLVVVKSGSIYLDAQLPVESIAEELIVFKTQQNNFDIYIYGDVPISEREEPGKFYFDATSVKSFTTLDESLFENLPVNEDLKLLPVKAALKKQGIGVFPVKFLVAGLVVIGFVGAVWGYFSYRERKAVVPTLVVRAVDPFAQFKTALTSPAPTQVVTQLVEYIYLITGIPGWETTGITYDKTSFSSLLTSTGGSFNDLNTWALANHVNVSISGKAITASMPATLPHRSPPTTIYTLKSIVSNLADSMNTVLSQKSISLGRETQQGQYQTMSLSIILTNVTGDTLLLVGEQFNQLPLVLDKAVLTVGDDGFISGQLSLTALGN